jgi:hypothetical protein
MAYNSVNGTLITGLGPVAIRNLVDIVQLDFVITLKYFDQSEKVLEVQDYQQACEVILFIMHSVTDYNINQIRTIYLDCNTLSTRRLRDDVLCVYLIEWFPKASTDANRITYHGVHVKTKTGKDKYAFQTPVGKSTFFIAHVN